MAGTVYEDSYKTNLATAFLESPSIIVKAMFLIVVLVVFTILFRVGIFILSYTFEVDKTPTLIDGLKKGKTSFVITQDPSQKNSIPVIRSKNERDGLEFTWSVWLLIDDIHYLKGQYRHIFHKGNNNFKMSDGEELAKKGLNYPNNAPGLYIAPDTNDLVVVMNTFSNVSEQVPIKNIPLNKWFNIMIRCEGNNLDVYMNGLVVVRRKLADVPKQNYGNVYTSQNGGFSGYLSDLKYFNHAVHISDVNKIMRNGPNMKTDEDSMTKSYPPYLSFRWFLRNDSEI